MIIAVIVLTVVLIWRIIKMEINNPQVFDHIVEIGGDIVRAELLTPVELAGKTLTGEQVVWKDRTTGDYALPEMIKEQNGNVILTKIVSLGLWNMDTTENINISHGIGSGRYHILSIQAMIFEDGVSKAHMLNHPQGGGVVSGGVEEWDNGSVYLWRLTGGYFDSAVFDSMAMTRGHMTILYTSVSL